MNIAQGNLRLGVLDGRRILVVDDVAAERTLLATFLQRHGCRVYLASNGADGFRKAQLVSPDLVLMDVRMPVCDGIEACRLLQADPALSNTPVIFLSGAAMPEERVAGLLAGGVDYVTKPFNFDEVRLRLAIHVRQRGHQDSAGMAERRASDIAPTVSNLDALLFESASGYLLRHLGTALELSDLADMVGTYPKRLNEAFKQCAGMTVFEFLREERMKQACHLLVSTNLAVQTIAEDLGYTSGANFATAFKERFGLTPIRYRHGRSPKEIG
ncbi:response regulator transcription factor [Imbroritus primus]|uniref:Response regulator transcription factor n=1 Tax=Imbroritus primus TaxID=3058603 RepID=A0ACD3SQ39_9BURK|nr:response regulator transcription factor [Burkholderiaceae bacterium PBA]